MNAVVDSSAVESSVRSRFNDDGFVILRNLLSQSDCEALAFELTEVFQKQQESSHKRIGGVRNVLGRSRMAKELVGSTTLISRINRLVGGTYFPIRAILFDKTGQSNWNVPWHQDLAIAVAEQIDTPGFGPWSVKDGVVHVQPPLHILRGMVALRLHLDDCGAENGALRVIPGSHLKGELSAKEITQCANRGEVVVCDVARGDILLMRPLLLHASPAAEKPAHRRVLHVEYAACDLPNGLKWLEWS